MSADTVAHLPQDGRSATTMQGHWLLARLGKRVLRPGGRAMTRAMLRAADLRGSDVVELAPGLGRTAADIMRARPAGYVGIEQDADAVRLVQRVVGERGTVRQADAADTGLPDGSADVVLGEAMLTMQGERAKAAIVAEAARVLRPGGRYAIHELALVPDHLADGTKEEIRGALARTIRVNARPLTIAEWSALLAQHDLQVEHVAQAPMALLQPRRIIADEGLAGAVRFARNLARDTEARDRVLRMRRVFTAHRRRLAGVAIVAVKRG
ncbi:class I SAM-dependent methyltransferase [Brachybacterium sp. DNPG3]